jgi:glutamine synthetase
MLSFKNFQEVKEFMEHEEIQIVDLKFIDLLGAWRHVTIPGRALNETSFNGGYGIDGSSVFSSKKVTRGDMKIIPDRSFAFMDPFWGDPCLSFVCNLAEVKSGRDIELDPRSIARKAESYLSKQDFADTILISPELEYYLLDEVEWHNTDISSGFRVGSHQSSPPSMTRDEDELMRNRIHRQSGYLVAPPQDSNFLIRQEISELLEESEIAVRYHHHEVGNLSQEEIEVEFLPFVKGCDSALLAKYIIKNVAAENGMIATFMPKPIANQAGTGMHIHMNLKKDGTSILFKKGGYADLDELAIQFISGILEHGRAIMAISCASTNSYRRLKPGFETPTSFYFSEANREAAIRIPGYATTPETKRFEFRPSDATGNIYLTVSALVMAGIDGIKRKINSVERGFGPFDGPGPALQFSWENQRLFLPRSYEEALYALRDDWDFLMVNDVFTRSFLETYIDYKWETEILTIWGRPHPFEFDLYFDL